MLNKNENKTTGKRSRIVEAARRIFEKYGYSKTTVEDIASSLGMKKSSMYYYFKNKEDIFQGVISSELDHYLEASEKAIAEVNGTGPKLKTFIRIKSRHLKGAIHRYNMTMNLAMELDGVMREIQKVAFARDSKLVKRIIDEGIKTGELQDIDSDKLSGFLVQITDALKLQELTGKNPAGPGFPDLTGTTSQMEYLVDIMLKGIKKK